MDSTSVICNIFNMGFKHSEAYASELRWSQNRNAAVTLLPSGFCAAVVFGGRFTAGGGRSHNHRLWIPEQHRSQSQQSADWHF